MQKSLFETDDPPTLQERLTASLQKQLATVPQCPEYTQKTKMAKTPGGMVYLKVTARARRTSDSGCIGWPTPKAQRPEQATTFGRGGNNLTLGAAAELLAGWNTPRATDGSNGGPNQAGGALPADAELAGWATPRANDVKGPPTLALTHSTRGTARMDTLPLQPATAACPEASGPTVASSPAATGSTAGFRLNPAFSLWLMGFRTGWARCGARVTPSSRKRPPSSSGRSSTPKKRKEAA